MKKTILGIQVTNPTQSGEKLQQVLTNYGCAIRTRVGLHNDEDDNEGLIILELMDDTEEITNLKKALSQLDDIEIKEMIFG